MLCRRPGQNGSCPNAKIQAGDAAMHTTGGRAKMIDLVSFSTRQSYGVLLLARGFWALYALRTKLRVPMAVSFWSNARFNLPLKLRFAGTRLFWIASSPRFLGCTRRRIKRPQQRRTTDRKIKDSCSAWSGTSAHLPKDTSYLLRTSVGW